MARYSFGMTATIAGTTTLPIAAILSTASVTPILREATIINTTAVACTYRLVKFTAGTAGADQTEHRHRRNGPAAVCIAKAGWTGAATIGEDTGYHIRLGAADGSGYTFTFGAEGLEGDVGSTAGIGFVPVGTGQICEVAFVWDE